MSTPPILILGAGGHAKVLIAAVRAMGGTVLGATDGNPARKGASVLGVPVLGGDEALDAHPPETVALAVGVGDTKTRHKLFDLYKAKGYRFAAVVHPSALIGPECGLGEGAQIMAGAILQPSVTIGDNAIVNTGARIDHDCRIGAHAHVAPGATLCGGVSVGTRTLVGAGASVIPGVTIGDDCRIGAGSAVIADVAGTATVVGVPGGVRATGRSYP